MKESTEARTDKEPTLLMRVCGYETIDDIPRAPFEHVVIDGVKMIRIKNLMYDDIGLINPYVPLKLG